MKVWQVTKKVGLDALEMSERPQLQPKANEVLIKMHAVALNYRDLLVIKDSHQDMDQLVGVIPCSDGAGEVVGIGPEVKSIKVGDKVTSCFMPAWLEGELSAEK